MSEIVRFKVADARRKKPWEKERKCGKWISGVLRWNCMRTLGDLSVGTDCAIRAAEVKGCLAVLEDSDAN